MRSRANRPMQTALVTLIHSSCTCTCMHAPTVTLPLGIVTVPAPSSWPSRKFPAKLGVNARSFPANLRPRFREAKSPLWVSQCAPCGLAIHTCVQGAGRSHAVLALPDWVEDGVQVLHRALKLVAVGIPQLFIALPALGHLHGSGTSATAGRS
jgi:hypothetical protein